MKLTVNGVDIEIEGAAEVEVDGDKVKIKTREPSQPVFIPSPFWVQPRRPYWERTPYCDPQITWTSGGTGSATSSCVNMTCDPHINVS